jgi:putative membrane protein
MVSIRRYIKDYFIIILFIIGISLHIFDSTSEYALLLTPLFLFTLYFFIIALFIYERLYLQFLIALVIGSIAFAIEAVGVNTGLIFGDYQYGVVLGVDFLSTPLVIGALWYLVISGGGVVFSRFDSKLIQVLMISIFAVILDIFIEPVAISLGYWSWASGEVPIQNYVGWFITAVLLSAMYLIRPVLPSSRSFNYLVQIYVFLFIFFLALGI